jgi:hypothetical protein
MCRSTLPQSEGPKHYGIDDGGVWVSPILVVGRALTVVSSKCMKIVENITLIEQDPYPSTWAALDEIQEAIQQVRWPVGADDFAIFPESGKKSGQGSGVLPIRTGFIVELDRSGWIEEAPFPIEIVGKDSSKFGKMDAAKAFDDELPFTVEWETGNISSSHRAMNKMCIGLVEGALSGGVLVVPSTNFAKYLTDRIGNIRELRPYFSLWANVVVERGYLGVIVVEHDRTDLTVDRIRKGTDGRARR